MLKLVDCNYAFLFSDAKQMSSWMPITMTIANRMSEFVFPKEIQLWNWHMYATNNKMYEAYNLYPYP